MLMRWLHENARINFYHVGLIVKEVELRLCDDVTSNTYPSSSRCYCWLSILFCKSFFEEVCIYWVNARDQKIVHESNTFESETMHDQSSPQSHFGPWPKYFYVFIQQLIWGGQVNRTRAENMLLLHLKPNISYTTVDQWWCCYVRIT